MGRGLACFGCEGVQVIESSILVILLGFAGYLFMHQRHEDRLAHLGWVVSGMRQNRDYLELQGRVTEAYLFGEIADTLSMGAGHIAFKMAIGASLKAEIYRAAMTASQPDHLVRIGLVDGSRNYSAAKDALYWLAKKSCDKDSRAQSSPERGGGAPEV